MNKMFIEALIAEVLSLNPKCLSIGQGKLNNLLFLAENAKREMKETEPKKAWAHHPRGGIVIGYPSKVKAGRRSLATTPENAKEGLGMSFPASQVYFTQPPVAKDELGNNLPPFEAIQQ